MGKTILDSFKNYIKNNRGSFFGSLLGLIAAILILTIGFFKTVFIYILVAIGKYIGACYDRGYNLGDILVKIKKRINKEYM